MSRRHGLEQGVFAQRYAPGVIDVHVNGNDAAPFVAVAAVRRRLVEQLLEMIDESDLLILRRGHDLPLIVLVGRALPR